MSSSALDSQGVIISYLSVDSPTTYTAIPEVVNIQGPGGQANEIDVTDLNSTAKEFRMGLQDEGSITMDILYIPANASHAALRTARAGQTLTGFFCKDLFVYQVVLKDCGTRRKLESLVNLQLLDQK